MIVGRLWSRIAPIASLAEVWPYVRPDRRLLGRAASITLLLTAVEVSIPLLSRAYLDEITGHGGAALALLPEWATHVLVGLLLVAAISRGGLLGLQRALAGRIGERTAARLRTGLWTHLQALPVETTRQRGSGRLLVRFVTDIRAVQRLVTDVLIRGTQDLLVTAGVLSIMVWLNWWLALPALLLLPTYAAIFWLMNPRLRRHSRVARRRRARLSAFLNERIVGMKVVKAHGQERTEAIRVRQMTRSAARRGARLAAAAATLQGTAVAALTCSLALTLALAPGEIAAGRLTSGTLVAFIMLLGLLTPVLRRLAQLNRTAQEAHVSLTRLRAALDLKAETTADARTRRLRLTEGHLRVRGVSLATRDGSLVLDRVSVEARRGWLVAIIGPNGSGKSTLLDLILRFRRPTSGRIVVDGQRIERVSLASLRAQIGWVPQEAVLFDGTILENVTYGLRTKPKRSEVRRAIRRAGLDEVAARLPAGLKTRVGPGEGILSHGERQRIALARVLIANPPILVLDELSSGADAEADAALARTLRRLARTRTIVVASHQIPVLRAARRIYVLDRGRVAEQGKHQDLLREGTLYRRLVGAWPPLAAVPPREPRPEPPGEIAAQAAG